jgi:hypothetical protein
MSRDPLRTTLNAPIRRGEHIMNGFQHLPEYASAARSYRLERTVVEHAPRRTHEGPGVLRRLVAALTPARRVQAAR